LYRARYSVQMPHICTAWSLGLVQMWDALSVSVSPPPSHLFFFSLFSFLSLFFFSRSQSRPHATHSQSQNIQQLIQIIYLTITYNSYTSHKLQDSQHILDHNIHNPFASHNISKTTVNLMNVSRTSKNQEKTHTRASPSPCAAAPPAYRARPCRRGTPRPRAAWVGRALPLISHPADREREM
jgi:hypothetical protein